MRKLLWLLPLLLPITARAEPPNIDALNTIHHVFASPQSNMGGGGLIIFQSGGVGIGSFGTVNCSTNITCTSSGGVLTITGSAGGGGTTINSTNNVLPKRSNATTFVDSAITDNGTTVSVTEPITTTGSISSGAPCTPAGATATGGICMTEGTTTGWTPTAGFDYIRASTTHAILYSLNGGGEFPVSLFSITPVGGRCLQSTGTLGLITETAAACGTGTITFPATVAGTVTSGGIPYFNSTTQMSSSALLALNGVVLGGGAGGANTSPWLIGTTEDDADYLWGFHHQNFGWSIGIIPPYVQFQNSLGQTGNSVFTDPVMYTKQQWGTWLCGTRYANVAALNAAWGSTYTTCGSSAVTSGTETIGTGNGASTSFSYSFAHGPVDPASIGIRVAGTLQGGDTPWFNVQNLGSSGTGLVQSATGNINGGTVSYNSGGAACGGQAAPCITVTFSAAPANGAAITATYQYGGWPKATAGGTGLLDEDGSSSWYPTEAAASASDPPVSTIPTDMSLFLGLAAKQYFQTFHDWVKVRMPNHLLFGPDSLQGSGPTWSTIVTNAAPYLDAFMLGGATPEYNNGQSSTQTTYNQGGIPIFIYQIKQANPDSPYSGTSCAGNVECMPTQTQRGALYFKAVNSLINNYTGSDGWKFVVGTDYWQFTDNLSELANFGLISVKDNLYGYPPACPSKTEDTINSIVDCYGYTTTPETTTYGNYVNSGVVCGNQLWLGITCNNPSISSGVTLTGGTSIQ